jgi:phenylacetate-CoA ligase
MFYQKEAETMPVNKIRELQLERLRRELRFCSENVPFYAKRLKEAGVTDNLKTLKDIRNIPFTTKESLRDAYPFGLFGQPLKKIVRIHASSGTTGKPTVVGYTKNDIDIWSDCMARLCAAAGAVEDDIFHIAFGYGLFTGALGLHYGLEKIGCTIVPVSSGLTERNIMLMQDFQSTGLVSTPTYAQYIGETAREMGVLDKLNLRLGLFGSEGCTEEMRTQIEKTLNLFATDNYGMSELMGPGVSGECRHRCGMHINEDHFYAEIINPETAEVLDEGETGELVLTTLTKEGIPMLRYRTKDITRLNYDVCECGRTFVRMDKVKGRSDDMLKIRGVNVFPSQIESVLMTFEQIAPHYQLVVTRKDYADRLEIKVELADSSLLEQFSRLEGLQDSIREKVKLVLGLTTKVTLVEHKSLERFQGKAKRILDLRTASGN